MVSGSVIVEGERRSGSQTQAEFCLRNKRILFGVAPTGLLLGKMISELLELTRFNGQFRGS